MYTSRATSPKHILNVDDNEISRYAITKVLKHAGFNVYEASCGNDALKFLKESLPNLVLLDVNLPDMSGYEVCRRLKSDDATRTVPVLQMSATFVKTDDRVRGLQGGADGYLTEPIEPEVLVATVNAMLRVHEAEEEKRKALEGERLARMEAQRLNRLKDEFLATLAHELRNPLAPVRNAVAILRGKPSEGVSDRALQILDRQVTHLSRMIDDLTDVARIEHRKIELKLAATDARRSVMHALEISRSMFNDRNHKYKVELPEKDVFVKADPVRLEQILCNLLNNAAKYSGDGSNITVSMAEEDHFVRFSVKDDGLGIPQEMLSDIFNLFTQIKQPLDRSAGGLGIGLTLTKHLVELHEGTIEARSGGHGQGAEFVFRLPKSVEKADVATPKPHAHAGGTGKLRILLVEDYPDTRDSFHQFLTIIGHTVEVAENGIEGLKKAKEFDADVAILDLGLPGMDGYDLAKAIRALDKRQPYLIALSGYGQAADKARAEDAGFNIHLTKPVDLSHVTDLLRSIEV